MLTHLSRTWRIYSYEKARAALALRLGPHLARDIGIDRPTLWPTRCPATLGTPSTSLAPNTPKPHVP